MYIYLDVRVTILIVLLIIAHCKNVSAQSHSNNADSMIAELEHIPSDTNKVKLLIDISDVYFQRDPELSKQYGQKVLDLSAELHYDFGRARGDNLVGRCYAVQNNLPMALKYFNDALSVAHKIKNRGLEAALLTSKSAVYAANDDFGDALQCALEAKKIHEAAGTKYMVNLMINIGYLYIRQDKYSEAIHYYNEGLRQENAYGSDKSLGDRANLYLNLGSTYVRTKEYVKSLEFLFKALDITRRIGHTKNEAISLADIGGTYVLIAQGKSKQKLPDSLQSNNNNLSKAQYYLAQARNLGDKLDLIDIRSEVYSSMADMYELRKQYDSAFYYFKHHAVLNDSLRDIGKEKEFAKIQAQFAVQKQTDSLNYLNAIKDKEIRQKQVERNGGILLIGLAGITALLFVNRQKLKHIQERKIAEADKLRTEELAKQQLDDFTRSIQEKNELLEKFSSELEKYKSVSDTQDMAEKEHSIQQLQNSVILNDEQWISFQSLFNKVHAGYISRVKSRFADLTNAELRFILLTKLGLSNKEMAAMLGVSAEAVRVSKHRLLKKIQLPEDISLEEAVQAV